MVDTLFNPPAAPIAAIRAAVLFSDTGEDLLQSTLDAGLALAYVHDLNMDYLDLENVPSFDCLIAGLPSGDDERIEAFEFGMRFLRVHRPGAFVMVAERRPSETGEFLHLVQDKAGRLGYRLSSVGLNSEDFGLPTRNGHAFAVGLLQRGPFVWPPAKKVRKPKTRTNVPTPTVRLPAPMPVPVVQAVIQQVADVLRR